jgi:hypothetical protein
MKKTISYLSAILAVVAVIHFSGCKQFDSNNEALVSDSGNIQQIAPGGIAVKDLDKTVTITITFANNGSLFMLIPLSNLQVGKPIQVLPLNPTPPPGVATASFQNDDPQSNPSQSPIVFNLVKGTVVISKYDTQNKRLEGLLQKCAFISPNEALKDTVDCAFFVNY